jgi:hypothetical protein
MFASRTNVLDDVIAAVSEPSSDVLDFGIVISPPASFGTNVSALGRPVVLGSPWPKVAGPD